MAEDMTTRPDAAVLLERVVIGGDLAQLTAVERLQYYREVCASLGLNPLTQPFEYMVLKGKLRLYAKRECTDQLRKLHGVSVMITDRMPILSDLYAVTARATDATGRADESLGVVSTTGLKGEDLANALMKAETKAKRRATLSICGLGMLDETEVETLQAEPTPLDDARAALVGAKTVADLKTTWEQLPEDLQASLRAVKDTQYRRLSAPTKLDAALAQRRGKPEPAAEAPPDAVA